MAKNDDLCDACGYHLILKKVIDVSDMKRPNKSTGFERLLQDQLHESESAHGTLLLMKIIGALMIVVVLFLCLGKWWWVGVLAVAGAGAFYWSVYRKRVGQQVDEDSPINADPISAALWSMLLAIQRALGWRKLEWPFPRATSLTLHDARLVDDELGELKDLSSLEALDFQGTSISDEGLLHLRGLKQLRFLVLRGTQVTPAGIRRLQSELPQTLIWH